MDWAELFDRGAGHGVTETDVCDALAGRRDGSNAGRDDEAGTGDDGPDDAVAEPPEPSPARVVADADVLAADLLAGGPSREALDHLRSHSWTTLVASDRLLDDAAATIRALVGDGATVAGGTGTGTGADDDPDTDPDPDLAAAWRARVASWREPVDHPAGDHPALGSAYRGGAMHLLSFDDRLTSARTGATLQGRVPLSVRRPDAFARLFDPASLYAEVAGGAYPGPDRDPRA
jgi:hypothetical protein